MVWDLNDENLDTDLDELTEDSYNDFLPRICKIEGKRYEFQYKTFIVTKTRKDEGRLRAFFRTKCPPSLYETLPNLQGDQAQQGWPRQTGH